MARNEHLVHASPQTVYDVLADPRSYAYWVVGSEEIRAADRAWPGAGSRFHHTVKIGPLHLKDHSEVEHVRPGRFLQLKVKGRPLGTARVKIELEPADGGTRVTMIEDPADAASALMFNPLTHRLVRGRNARSLDRLAELAEGRRPIPGEEPGAPNRTMHGNGSVQNPVARERREAMDRRVRVIGRATVQRLPASLRPRRGAPSIAGRRILITGGSSGIGLACAHELSARGARVVLLARGEEGLQRAAAAIDPRPATVAADVSDVEALRAAVDHAAERLGGLDAVVANAAAASVGPFCEMSVDDIHRTVESSLLGMLNTTHVALPHLERSAGRLVVVGSIAGRVPTPYLSVYTAAKHGVRGFVRTLRVELRALDSPVTVALVAPGPVDTPFWRRARSVDGRLPPRLHGIYRPEDVASEVVRAFAARPRTERSVGGLMAAVALVDALAPNLVVRVMGPPAGLAWRRRERRPLEPADALTEPVVEPHMHEGLHSRPSIAVKLRDLVGGGRA